MKTPTHPHPYLFKEVRPRTAARKARQGICKHWGCNRPVRQDTKRDCNTCSSRKTEIKHPERRAYRNIKISAKKRGIKFNLTFAQFKEFDRQTGYTESRGKASEDLVIDRIDPTRGYEFDNIRALTYQENCRRRLNGITDPAQPIAQALAKVQGHDIWQRRLGEANGVLDLVEILLAQRDGGFEPPIDEDEEDLPF